MLLALGWLSRPPVRVKQAEGRLLGLIHKELLPPKVVRFKTFVSSHWTPVSRRVLESSLLSPFGNNLEASRHIRHAT